MATKGQSLELFFIEGIADGMLPARIFNWTGYVLSVPRTQLAEGLKRPEAAYTGVYILLGESDDSNRTRASIGESEDVGERIRTHDTKLDWWTQVIVITSAADGLNKAHVKYLEARLVEEARRVGQLILTNGNTPPRASLSEAARANMEQFVEHLQTVLPAIRVDGFLARTRPNADKSLGSKTASENLVVSFILETPKNGVLGSAYLQESEFIVQLGSIGRSRWEGTPDHNYKKLFDEVVESGAFVLDGSHRKFIKPYAFSSASAAGAVLNGRATAGPIAWRLAADPKKTYKEWEAEQLGLR